MRRSFCEKKQREFGSMALCSYDVDFLGSGMFSYYGNLYDTVSCARIVCYMVFCMMSGMVLYLYFDT